MARALSVIVLLLVVANAARAQENVGAAKGRAGAGTLGGFDANLTLWESSGLAFEPEAYSNTLSLIVEPRFNIGRRWFRGRWAEPLALSVRLLLAVEFAGNDPAYRGPTFATPALLREAPEQVAIEQARDPSRTGYTVDGATRRLWYGDLWLSLTHGKVATIPKLRVDVNAGARVVLPTSLESRAAGLVAAPSLAIGLSRSFWRFTADYGFRAVKYFYLTNTAGIARSDGPGDHLADTGVLNPNWGFVNFFALNLDLPRGFSIDAYYFLFNVLKHEPSPYKNPDGLPTDVDGAHGDLRRPAQLDSQWFLLEVDYKVTSWWTIGLGLSTFQPVRRPNQDLANPFVRVARDNLTTIYLSLAVNAEALASALSKRGTR